MIWYPIAEIVGVPNRLGRNVIFFLKFLIDCFFILMFDVIFLITNFFSPRVVLSFIILQIKMFCIQMATTRKHETGKDMGMMTIDFRQRDGSLFEYNIQLVDDKVMGGSSSANALLEEVSHYFTFECHKVSLCS